MENKDSLFAAALMDAEEEKEIIAEETGIEEEVQEELEEEVESPFVPTKKFIDEKFSRVRKSSLEKGLYCKEWAKENNYHFLGFAVGSGEPIFKEKK